ncbi:hypothetical protein JCM5296_007298 [Sporobolomyces johnsonii]
MHTKASSMPASEPSDNLSSKLRALEVAIASEGAAAVDRQRSTDRKLTEIVALLAALQPTSPTLSTATPVPTPELAALSALVTDLALRVGKLELSVAQSVEAAPALKSEASQVVAPSCASAEPTNDNKSIDSAAPQSEAKVEGYAGMPAVVEADGKLARDDVSSTPTRSATISPSHASALEEDPSDTVLTESDSEKLARIQQILARSGRKDLTITPIPGSLRRISSTKTFFRVQIKKHERDDLV